MPYGKAIWQGHMARPYGKAIWQSHMAEPYGRAIWQPRPRLALRYNGRPETFFRNFTVEKSTLKNKNHANKNRLKIQYRTPYLKIRDLFSRASSDYFCFNAYDVKNAISTGTRDMRQGHGTGTYLRHAMLRLSLWQVMRTVLHEKHAPSARPPV